MSLRYYPSFRVKTDLITNGLEYRTKNGPYKGKYYITYDGKVFSGANPILGPNEELFAYSQNISSIEHEMDAAPIAENIKKIIDSKLDSASKKIQTKRGVPIPYFPYTTEGDYKKGYLLRSFIKRVNDKGFVTEISNEEYDNFVNGTVDYDVSDYLVLQILWKLTGPLVSFRVNQYDTRVGIIDTNKRLVENANKTFLGITDYIGGDYTKFARPTL